MSIINNIKRNTGMLIRFDDIAPNMNWKMMDKCEALLNQFSIKPVLGVIPDNKDLELLSYPKRDDFWKKIKEWQEKDWSIAMHGFSHLYDKDTGKKDFFGYGGKSEFFGHTYNEQISKIKKGLEIFKEKEITIDTFFAPNHTYDLNTFAAIKDSGINRIIDGYGLAPFEMKDIKFLPQLFYKLYMLPYGIQSTQIHINYWNEKDYDFFKKFIEKNHNRIINLETAFSVTNKNLLVKLMGLVLMYGLKIKRKIF